MLCVINVESVFSEALFGDDDVGKENWWWVVAALHRRSLVGGSNNRVALIPYFTVMSNNSKECPNFQYVLYKLMASTVTEILNLEQFRVPWGFVQIRLNSCLNGIEHINSRLTRRNIFISTCISKCILKLVLNIYIYTHKTLYIIKNETVPFVIKIVLL